MPVPPDDDPQENIGQNRKSVTVNLRLDPTHYAALERIAAAAHMKDQQVLRHLIRIADRFVQGKASPFVDELGGIFPKLKVG